MIGLIILYILTQSNIVSRYLLIVIPLIIIYSYWFLIFLTEIIKLERYAFIFVIVFTGIIMFQNQYILNKYVQPSIQSFTQGMQECFIPIGIWLRDSTSIESRVFIPDIGAVGYYSERTICDAGGLISPEILKYLKNGMSYQDLVNNKMYKDVCKADYVVHRSSITNDLQQIELEPLFYKPFYGLGLSNMETTYYTVYKVKK